MTSEAQILLKYGFDDEKIANRLQEGEQGIHLLHKYSFIGAAFDITIKCEKPILLVERGNSRSEAKELLEQHAIDTGMRMAFDEYRKIKQAPKEGIQLGDINRNHNDGLCWGAEMYFPD